MALQEQTEEGTEVGVVPEKRGDVVPEEKGVVPEKGDPKKGDVVPETGGAGEAATTGQTPPRMTPKGFFKGFLDVCLDTTTAFGSGLFGLLGDLGKSVDEVWKAALGLGKTVIGVCFSFIPEKKPEPKPAASSTSGEKQQSDPKQQGTQANKTDKELQKSAADPDKDGNAGDDDHEHGGAGNPPYSPPPTPSTSARRVGSSRVPGG